MPDGRESFKELLHHVNLIAVTMNTRFEVTYCNDYFLRLTGWTLEEVQGKAFQQVFVPAAIEDLTGLFTELFDDRPSAWHHQNDIVTRAGTRLTVRWNNLLLRDDAGNVVGAGGIGEDITDRASLERELLGAGERERRHLQSELHDGLGQELFGLALIARSLATQAERESLPIAGELGRLAAIADQAVDTGRRIARGMSPLSDIQGGLFQALRHLAQMPPDWRGPRVQFSGRRPGALRLPADSLEHVYRIAQEALTNAVKHADARHIDLTLDVTPKMLRLEIVDDGIGLMPGRRSAGGVGLKIMRYRANLLQARLEVERRPQGGTRLALECPQR